MKILKHTAVLLAAVMCIAAAGCNKTPAPNNAEFDRSGLYGMCYLLEERDYDGEYDMAAEVEIMKKEEIEAFQKKDKTKGLFLYEGKIFLTYEMLICAKNIEEAEIQLREYIEKLC